MNNSQTVSARGTRTPAQRRRFGDVTVTYLPDGYLEEGAGIFAGVTAEECAPLLAAAGLDLPVQVSVGAFLLECAGRIAVVDAGCGSGMQPSAGHLMAALRAWDVEPGRIDTVLLTHPHPDHVGGLVTPEGEARFYNAELRVNQADVEFFLGETLPPGIPEEAAAAIRMMRAGVAPYRERLRPFTIDSGSEEVFPSVFAVALPGHTPGHTGYRIQGDGTASLLIWGDIVHVPEFQARNPDIAIAFDVNPDDARRTRHAVFEAAAASGQVVAGMHLREPGFARITGSSEGYDLAPDTASA